MAELTADFPEIEDEEEYTMPDMGTEPDNAYVSGDESVAPYDTLSVVQAILQCFDESEEAREHRDDMNMVNYDAYHCRQDNSDKIPGQSMEFLPKVQMGVEQFAAFIRKGLTSFGDYFDVDLSPDPDMVGGPLTNGMIVKLIRHRLEDPAQIPPGCLDFPTLISDGVKVGSLGARMIAKVCGRFVTTRRPVVRVTQEPMMQQDPLTGQTFMGAQPKETLDFEEGQVWRGCVELIRPEDHFPDPKNRGLFEIHRTFLDLHEVVERSDGEYPEFDGKEEVLQLVEDATHYSDAEVESEMERQTDQPEGSVPSFRKEVELLYFYGTLLDSDGSIAHRNCCAVVANRKYLISKPHDNPYWHQGSGIVSAPLLRVPFSTFHKGLFDHAVRLNLAMNELFNLIVDGAIGAVWGVREVRKSWLENPEDFDKGVPQGSTAFLKEEVPEGASAVNMVTMGGVPQDALATFQLLDREHSAATMLTDTAKGQTPRSDVSATAVASADQSTSLFFDSIIATLEQSFIRPILRLFWLNMLQNADDWNEEDIKGILGEEAAMQFQQMSPARRYATYAMGVNPRVTGLSSMVSRARDFQKKMSLMAAITQSPPLLQSFYTSFNPDKILNELMKDLNIDPENFRLTKEEAMYLPEKMQELQMFAMLARGGQGNQQAQVPGVNTDPGSPTQAAQASIAQQNQPPQGM